MTESFYPRTHARHQTPDLVVDDEATIADTLAMILDQAGYDARSFHHPKQAIDATSVLRPDLLISDVAMPGMTAVELAIHFRKTQPQCKVLLFSGQASTASLLDKAHQVGYDFEILTKHVLPADLLAKIRD